MAEPSPDDIDLDACFEEVYGGAMAEGVWVQTVVLLPQCAAFQRGGVPLNDFVDSESCERLPLLRKEHSAAKPQPNIDGVSRFRMM